MAAPNANVTVVTETRNLKTGPFVDTDNPITTGKAWEEWLEGIEREFRYFKIANAQDKTDALIIYGGKDIARLAKSLPDVEEQNEADCYEKLTAKLNNYFKPKKNMHHARYLFMRTRMNTNESTIAYAARVREKAVECEFGATLEDRILEHLIQTINNPTLVQKAISKTWTLKQLLSEAAQLEDVQLQIADMKVTSSHDELKVAKVIPKKSTPSAKSKWKKNPHSGDPPKQHTGHPSQGNTCSYCGYGRHAKGQKCPAYGRKCAKCGKFNHYAAVCRTGKQQGKKPHNVKKAQADVEASEGTSSDDEFLAHMQNVKIVIKKVKSTDNKIIVKVGGIDAYIELDSGADANVMDEHQYKALVNRSNDKLKLEPCDIKLSALQTDLEVKGKFHTTVQNETRGVRTKFIVVKGKIKSPPLLGRETSIALGMMELRPNGTLKNTNELKADKVQKVTAIPTSVQEILQEHPEVFKGIGKIHDNRNNREVYARFHMRPEAAPVAQKPRQVPYYLQKPLKEWLAQCIEEEIYEEIPDDEPVTWCSPLVVQPKPRFKDTPKDKLGPDMIRASIDLRVVNKHMERSRITQSPIVEDFTYNFHDCKVFSK